jgi:DNA-binding transcriptional LysR family regulator
MLQDGFKMDLYHLKTFFTLAKARNFTRAADQLFVTQSAVSHAIKKLEASVNTPLFERKTRQLGLTPAGHALYASCEKIFYEIEQAGQDMALFSKEARINIRVGSTIEFGTSILLKHIHDFLEKNAEVHLDFYFSPDLKDPLLRDEIDMAIDCDMHNGSGLERIHLFQEQYVTIASPLFLTTHQIHAIDDLAQVNILSYDKQLNWWRNFTRAIPEDKRRCLKHVIQINHVRGIINGALSGLGVGFVPKYTVIRELEEKTLIDPFPHIRPEADHFNIFIKKTKISFKKNRQLINYLTQLKPSEFGVA